MELVQWIARRAGDTALLVRFVPAGAAQLQAAQGWPALRRRGPTLQSPHLLHPLVAAVAADVVADDAPAAQSGPSYPTQSTDPTDPTDPTRADAGLVLRVSWATGADDALAPDDVRFASEFGEFVAVVAALVAAAGLPLVVAHPTHDGVHLDVVLGDVGGIGRARLADALTLCAVAVRTAALARGFDAKVAVVVGPAPAPVDGRIEETL
ncbi:MAG: hypothetical protein FJ137_14740 [Deltaproteobacteria bacterium]|nr:hypothetical protein [Deltaproteobacteria bacterium]